MEKLKSICLESGLYLFSDEAYREFCYDGEYVSAMHLDGVDQHVVLMDTVSKRYSACGARIGAFITRNKEVYDAAMKFAQARLSPPGLGQILGEASFLDGRPRPTAAVAVEKGVLLRFKSGGLRRWLVNDHELGAALARSFWHSLAAKIRQANQFMAEIVPLAEAGERPDRVPGQNVELMPGAKMDLFQETGLSAAELRLLATTLHAQYFPRDAYLFHEREAGESLYIVFDGEVRISRQMSSRGEEPLAILGRGEVFGEMALVDDQVRSADARAHTEGCTVLVLSQADLDEVLHMPSVAASQFLYLVCGVLSYRLRAMISLLASWRTRLGIGQDNGEEPPGEQG